jgi:four helix bundle protein
MAAIGGYKDLVAWQKGMDLVEVVYRLSARFAADERYGLTAQVRRAAVSVPSNIAEGYSRPNRSDYTHFLDIARGSANEVETQLLLAVRLGYVTNEQAKKALDLTLEVQRILAGLVKGLEKSQKRSIRGDASR